MSATIDWNDVAVFVRVVDAGSFTRAALQLGLPKSAVSRKLARLEEALGARLLTRTTRKLNLTDAGRSFHRSATVALATLEEAVAGIGELQSEPRGTVRISTVPELAEKLLAEPLARFSARHPKIRVELVLTTRFVDLVAEGIDFALRAGALQDSALIARSISRSPLLVLAAPSYLSRRGTPKKPEELAQHDCILFRPEAGQSRWTLTSGRAERTVTVTGPVAADDYSFVHAIALRGIGICLAPVLGGTRALARQKRLVRVLPEWCGPVGKLFLVYPPARHEPQRVLLLREYLYEHLKETLAEDAAS